jgi:DDE superfamily endonuclease
MPTSHLGSSARHAAPPPLDLPPRERAALADEVGPYQAALAALDDRKAQVLSGSQSWHGLRRPLARQAIEPMALAWDGGEVHALPPLMGQGQWPDEALRPPHGRVLEATVGAADGVRIGEPAACPPPGEPAVGVARPWGGRLGTVATGPSGVCTADASRPGDTRVDRRRALPDAWFDAAPRERWHAGGRPAEPRVQTKPAVALARRPARVAAGSLGGRGVTGEEACGREPACLDGVAAWPRRVEHRSTGRGAQPGTAGLSQARARTDAQRCPAPGGRSVLAA